jgi:hypothetical protein
MNVIKRVALTVICVCLGVWLYSLPLPWGGEVGQQEPNARRLPRNSPFYILKQVSAGKPVHVFLSFETTDLEPYRDQYEEMIRTAYGEWFDMSVYFIEKSGQQKNFVRMLERLRKGIEVQFVPSAKSADLQVVIATSRSLVQQRCSDSHEINQSAEACVVYKDSRIPVLYMPDIDVVQEEVEALAKQEQQEASENFINRYFAKTFYHELGHTLGLADQYQNANPAAAAHRLYRSTHIREGVMNGAWGFTCDDADGIINLIDIMHGTELNRQHGWHSLCQDSPDVYVNGIAQGTGPYVLFEEKGNWFLTTYKDGKKQSKEKFPIVSMPNPLAAVADQAVLEKDGLNRPVLTQGPKGEMVYHQYNYGHLTRLVTVEKKALRWESQNDEEFFRQESGTMEQSHYVIWHFQLADGTMAFASVLMDRDGMLGIYQQGPDEDPLLRIEVFRDGEEEDITTSGSLLSQPPANPRYPTLRERTSQTVTQKEVEQLTQQFKTWLDEQADAWKHSLN